MQWRIPLAEPDIGEEEIDAVVAVLRSKWLTMGPVTEQFEAAFAAKMNVKHALAVTNATAALHLANVALGIQPDDEVICPELTFVASANATRYTGARVIFARPHSESDLTIDPRDIEAKITPRTKAITIVHYAGFLCAMDEILATARSRGLHIIEDCAHSPFAYRTSPDGTRAYAGAFGAIGCFSFFGNKNLTTGEGGMLTTNDDALAAKLKLLRSHGMTTLTYDRHRGHASGYDVVALGYNYRIDEMRAAIGLAQLSKIDRINEARRERVAWYREAFADCDGVHVPFGRHNLDEATCHIMPVLVRRNLDAVRQRLLDLRIQTSKHYAPVPSFSIYGTGTAPSSFPWNELLTLPLSHTLTRDDVGLIRSAFA